MTAEPIPEFNLRDLVRSIVDATEPIEQPAAIAARVLDAIPGAHLRDALAATLPGYVAAVVGDMRRHPLRQPTPQNQSPRVVRAIQSNWDRIRASIIHVGENAYKRFGECTFDDLMYAAAERREQAAQHEAWAERWTSYAHLLRASGADTVDALPDEAKAKIEADYT